MLSIIGIVFSFFLSFIIFTKKGKTMADTILGIWLIVIGLHLLTYYSYVSGLVYQYPLFLGVNLPIPFFHGPLLFLYTLALTQPSKVNIKTWALHSILPLLIILLFSPFFLLSSQQKEAVFKNEGKGYENIILIAGVLMNISGIYYVIVNFILLNKHKKSILNQFSNQEKINLNWLRFLYYMMAVMWVLIIIIQNDSLIFSATSVFVLFIGYFGIKQAGVFSNTRYENFENEAITVSENNSNKETETKKYAKSGLSEEAAVNFHKQLQTLMKEKRLFTEPELTLTELADRLEIHPNYLSQIINEKEGVNFYDYVNGLRIEEFKRLVVLPENEKFTLLALAFDCGFNSKSAFNRIFKKSTGMSPSEFAKLKTQNPLGT